MNEWDGARVCPETVARNDCRLIYGVRHKRKAAERMRTAAAERQTRGQLFSRPDVVYLRRAAGGGGGGVRRLLARRCQCRDCHNSR
jgi:hypothetical protein